MTLEGVQKKGFNGWGCICKNWNGVPEDWEFHSCNQVRIQLPKVEEKVVERQLEAMRKMGGNPFWPKPILHPSVEENFDRLICI